MAVMKINAELFQTEVLENTKTVLVDFFADWCGPCKMLAPLVEEIANENAQCAVYKINVDEAPDIAARYGVMSIPTLISFRNGEAIGRLVGVQGKQSILKLLA